MGEITVMLDETGRPIGTCTAGRENEWMAGKGGENQRQPASMVSATDEQWHAWARRNAQAGKTGKCIPW